MNGQTVTVSIDTGSTDTAVALSTCTNCDVASSVTDAPGLCTTTPASTTYGDGSGWTGYVCSAPMQVGAELPVVTVDFGGITDNKQFLPDYTCSGGSLAEATVSGILGLGPLDLDSIGQQDDDAYFNELVQQGVTDTLAVLLCPRGGGYLWFGGYDSDRTSGTPQYTPMSRSAYWTVNAVAFGLGTGTGAKDLNASDSEALVDTGTDLFYMPETAFTAFVDAMSDSTAAAEIFGVGVLSESFFSHVGCAAPTGGQTEADINAALPPFTIELPLVGGGLFTLVLPATESYLTPDLAGSGQYCAAAVSSGSDEAGSTILGDSVLHANVTIFNEARNRIGFVPQTACH